MSFNREAFKQGIRVLTEVTETRRPFNMLLWAIPIISNSASKLVNDYNNCQTAACAIGWMARDKWFISQGLTLDKLTGQPSYDGWKGFSAVSAFFDISHEDAHSIFYGDAYDIELKEITPKMVSDVMQSVLDKKEAS